MVIKFILKNCNDQDCIRGIKSDEIVRNYKYNDFIKEVILSSESHIKKQQNQVHPSYVPMTNFSVACTWPVGRSPSTSSDDIENNFPIDLKITHMENIKPVCENSAPAILSKESSKNIGNEIEKNTANIILTNDESNEKNKRLKRKTPLRLVPRSFVKPKNIIEFKVLLRAAEQHIDYPAVLCNPKTKFLGSFGLAPKQICSKRTLSKVEMERKRRKAQYVQNIMNNYQNRKNLRDRNKLNKIKLKERLEKIPYLDKFKRGVDEVQGMASKRFFGNMMDGSYSDYNVISSADDSEIEIVKVVPKKEVPEIIEIASSDEENNNKCLDTMLTGDSKKTTRVKNNLEESKTLRSHLLRKSDSLCLDPQDKKASTSRFNPSHTPVRHYPIFNKNSVMPTNSKEDVVVVPFSYNSARVMPNLNKPVCLINTQATNPVKLTKDMMLGKKAILLPKLSKDTMQSEISTLPPISSAINVKSFSMQKMPTQAITNKIPRETNVYLVQKQPSGIIKMVPCSRAVTTDNTNAQCSKETSKRDRPSSNAYPVNYIGDPAKAKYRSILPLSNDIINIRRQETYDLNKDLINGEMSKLSQCIEGMKFTMARTYYQLNVQRSKQRLESQMNAAIALVKNIRRKLWEIEKLEEKMNYDVAPTNTKNLL